MILLQNPRAKQRDRIGGRLGARMFSAELQHGHCIITGIVMSARVLMRPLTDCIVTRSLEPYAQQEKYQMLTTKWSAEIVHHCIYHGIIQSII
mmetsp:Transcript_30050/g.56241  ORF Transcript_30050/g.56241 Transcript_30050/m.56241 type:complete len:93 (+) Transcript_30050:190-468(+)